MNAYNPADTHLSVARFDFTRTDHSAIAYDQQKMEEYLAKLTATSFQSARDVYEQGAYSKSVAVLSIGGDSGLPISITAGTVISAPSVDGGTVSGTAMDSYNKGEDSIEVQYQTSEKQDGYVGCQVGGNPDPFTDGCFAATGTFNIDGNSISYSYSVEDNNVNERTIEGFSTKASTRMRPDQATAPYFPDFQKFVDYYGTPDYADKWVTSAFDGTSTGFTRGNADFSTYDFEGRAEAIKKGTAYMSIAMYAIREMEDAIVDCEAGCDTAECNDDAVHALDEAVAFYTGATEGKDGSGDGHLMYALADKRCVNFRTCGDKANSISGKSKVNIEIFKQFSLMQGKLLAEECSAARKHKNRVVQLMWVPLIQGTLRYAYITETEPNPTEKAEAEGAVFAASVIPVVAHCSPSDADFIWKNMKTGQDGTADFSKVKKVFEKQYDCMGITCADVGGIWNDAAGNYMPGAAPCSGSGSGSSVNVGLAVGLSIGGLVALGLILFLVRRRKTGTDTMFKGDSAEHV